jgi:hypothetical protein
MHVIAAAGVLLLLTCAVTWPLAANLSSALPGDYGDPLFVSWVMSWVAGSLTPGSPVASTSAGFWDANIFFPESGALAFSEHFIAQTVMVLPVVWATGNPLVGYNVAFMATFVLAGVGTYLLAQAMTGSRVAAFVAAFVVAFNEYRLAYEVAHLHVLSIHWLPFVLLTLWRYFETDRRRWLALAAVAAVALNLSSIYYMAYCAPFVIAFAVFGAFYWRRARQLRTWLELWATAAAVALVTVPFLLPYLSVQQRLAIVRSQEELTRYSATLDHYRAAWPGLAMPFVLAAVAVALALLPGVGRRLRAEAARADAGDAPDLAGRESPGQPKRSEPGDRTQTRALRVSAAFLALMLVLSFWLSLGPVVQSGGQALSWPGLYTVLHEHVPGFGALRVPARFAMLFLFFLGLLAACGVASIRQRSRMAGVMAGTVALLVLIRATPFGVAINQPLPSPGYSPPPSYLTPSRQLPAIYRAVEALPAGAVLAEFPFGDPGYDLRYMYFSGLHGRRLMNGYSGVFPPSYVARRTVLAQPLLDPARATRAVAGATHIIVHRAAWADDTGALIGGWLEAMGAVAITDADGAVLYQLATREEYAHRR